MLASYIIWTNPSFKTIFVTLLVKPKVGTSCVIIAANLGTNFLGFYSSFSGFFPSFGFVTNKCHDDKYYFLLSFYVFVFVFIKCGKDHLIVNPAAGLGNLGIHCRRIRAATNAPRNYSGLDYQYKFLRETILAWVINMIRMARIMVSLFLYGLKNTIKRHL